MNTTVYTSKSNIKENLMSTSIGGIDIITKNRNVIR